MNLSKALQIEAGEVIALVGGGGKSRGEYYEQADGLGHRKSDLA